MQFLPDGISFSDMVTMDRTSNSSKRLSSDSDSDIFETFCKPQVLQFDSPDGSCEPMDVDHHSTPKSMDSTPGCSGRKRFKQTKISPTLLSAMKRDQQKKQLTLRDMNSSSSGTLPQQPPKKQRIGHGGFEQQHRIPVVVRKRGLIGDASRKLQLPTIRGRHGDLPSVSAETLSMVLQRNPPFELVKNISVVDCRYPYEFDAGHIRGAVNIHHRRELFTTFLHENNENKESSAPAIIVFHCEFSSERGPSLARALRNEDRILNKDRYPSLACPEIYLLEGGYKGFFEGFREDSIIHAAAPVLSKIVRNKNRLTLPLDLTSSGELSACIDLFATELCDPPFYKPMIADGHEEEMQTYRKKVKRSAAASSKASTSSLLPFVRRI